ncbi:MAG: hypothetical protein IPL61_28210 [Myxococcales bacterium]|nr:hypothetical protein [Myxococcales bacterium]
MRTLTSIVSAAVALALLAAPAAAERRHRGKPSAPVALTATAERTATGWRVVVDAAPTVAVDDVVVEIDGRATRFGATTARTPRHLVAPIALGRNPGKDVVVTARLAGRSQSLIVRVGAPAPAQKPQVITVRTINGVSVAEVRK